MIVEPLHDRLDQARQLLARLERISADSIWARRASGYRGSLLKWIDRAEERLTTGPNGAHPQELVLFERLHAVGLEILNRAARERLNKR
jgi:hypothetical protein